MSIVGGGGGRLLDEEDPMPDCRANSGSRGSEGNGGIGVASKAGADGLLRESVKERIGLGTGPVESVLTDGPLCSRMSTYWKKDLIQTRSCPWKVEYRFDCVTRGHERS